MTVLKFPDTFLWGASTAAHQIEGNNIASDLWQKEYAPGTTIKEPSGDACDSYNRYEEDIRLLSYAGLNTYRFSIEWARIEPVQGEISHAQLLHYKQMIDICKDNNVEPFVTIHHFSNPAWFTRQGGWESPNAVSLFLKYVEIIKSILKDVNWICTINEPNMVAQDKTFKPDPDPTIPYLPPVNPQVRDTLIEAHRNAREILSDLQAKTGWCPATITYETLPGAKGDSRAFAKNRVDDFITPAAGDDYIGVQAYQRFFIGDFGPVPTPSGYEMTKNGWEFYPQSLGIAAVKTWELGGHTPLVVTENGIATDDDRQRVRYTTEALHGLHDAMQGGVDVRGYLHWSLLDNYEWGSYDPTFGLIAVDRQTFERNPKPSLTWLGNLHRDGLLVE